MMGQELTDRTLYKTQQRSLASAIYKCEKRKFCRVLWERGCSLSRASSASVP